MLNERSKFLNEKNKELTKLTARDSMTGLFNKSSAYQYDNKNLRSILLRTSTCAFFADIDNFKIINDKHGHEEGDQLIIQFAKILQSYFREDNIVARFGGDEFIIFVKNIKYIKYVSTLDQIAEKLCKYIYIKSNEKNHYSFSTSIGVAISTRSRTTCEELMQNANKALYFSKSKGKNTFHIYDKKLDDYMTTT